ncbi:MAG: membrane protein insertase YidC, partial [Candidatus Aureabacteria bacterium]|nr:membrane protein insertase YidC [Candidatus Auribacterota bacterium]
KHIHNYGWAIIIMTIVIRVLTYPLNKKSIVSMKEMQVIQPQMKRLQEQYKNDPKRMQQELMLLYKKHGVNPMSGCFPMLIQIPVFFAFYKALASSVELQGASFFFIKDLASPDGVLSIPGMAHSINVLPLVMGITQLISQKQTMSDSSQKNMMYFFTIFITFIFYSMPSGLVLYFLVSNLLSIWQTSKIAALKKNQTEQPAPVK